MDLESAEPMVLRLRRLDAGAVSAAALAKSIRAGTPVGAVMGGDYEHMLTGDS